MENGQSQMLRAEFVKQLGEMFAHRKQIEKEDEALMVRAFIVLPAIFVFVLIPLTALGVLQPLWLLWSYLFLCLYGISYYLPVMVNDHIKVKYCIRELLLENPDMEIALGLTRQAQWADEEGSFWVNFVPIFSTYRGVRL